MTAREPFAAQVALLVRLLPSIKRMYLPLRVEQPSTSFIVTCHVYRSISTSHICQSKNAMHPSLK